MLQFTICVFDRLLRTDKTASMDANLSSVFVSKWNISRNTLVWISWSKITRGNITASRESFNFKYSTLQLVF